MLGLMPWQGGALALRLGLVVVVIYLATKRHLTQPPIAGKPRLTTHAGVVFLVVELLLFLGVGRWVGQTMSAAAGPGMITTPPRGPRYLVSFARLLPQVPMPRQRLMLHVVTVATLLGCGGQSRSVIFPRASGVDVSYAGAAFHHDKR